MKACSKFIHPDLAKAQEIAYEPSDLKICDFKVEAESQDYGASEFKIDHLKVKFRVAKITPTKIGQFVTLWKRFGNGPILPFDIEDPFDLFVISVRTFKNFGQFVFPKNLLCEKGILSKNGKGGKRAIRVYPPWDVADNKQAINTQKWQLPYFFEIPLDAQADVSRIKELYKSY